MTTVGALQRINLFRKSESLDAAAELAVAPKSSIGMYYVLGLNTSNDKRSTLVEANKKTDVSTPRTFPHAAGSVCQMVTGHSSNQRLCESQFY